VKAEIGHKGIKKGQGTEKRQRRNDPGKSG
jgi:hypothetical protein